MCNKVADKRLAFLRPGMIHRQLASIRTHTNSHARTHTKSQQTRADKRLVRAFARARIDVACGFSDSAPSTRS